MDYLVGIHIHTDYYWNWCRNFNNCIRINYLCTNFVFRGNVVPGWSSSLIATSFIGGIQLISLGVIGEYIGKIYMETKQRPRYIIMEKTYQEANSRIKKS